MDLRSLVLSTDSFRYSNELRVTLSALELVSENVNFNVFFTN